MSDLEFRSRGSLVRGARTGAALFGSGLVVGVGVTLLFGWLIRLVIVLVVVAVVLGAIVHMATRRRRY